MNAKKLINTLYSKESKVFIEKEDIENWLRKMKIENYIINKDLTVNVNGDVDLSYKYLKKIPIQFNIINGNFYCNNNELTSLKGCPHEVKKRFTCNNNKLVNLIYAPKKITESFDCSVNQITSLEGCPEVITGDFSCYHNKLTNLEGCPKEIKGDFSCDNNKLTNLENCTKKIGYNFNCNNNDLTSLKGCPEVINSNFYCNSNNLTDFKYFPLVIEGNCFSISDNNIKEEELVNFNCDISIVDDIYSDFNKNGNKNQFLEKMVYYKNIIKENELLKKTINNDINIKLNKKL